MNRHGLTLCTLLTLTPLEAKAFLGGGECKTYIPATVTVKQGDTLPAIAEKNYDDPAKASDIAKYNNLKEPYKLYPGQVLVLPDKVIEKYTLQSVGKPCPR